MREASGPAHVATVSFLASRAVPTGGFFVALAGGTALARVAQRRGARAGYGASIAAVLETVAIIGPVRFTVPFTQAVTAPMLGRLEARGTAPILQILTCAALRILLNGIGVAFFVLVIAGGLDAYAGTYDAAAERLGFSLGEGGTIAVTAAGLLLWGAFASTVQVGVYRRGLAGWPSAGGAGQAPPAAEAPPRAGRYDPRAVALAAAVGFGLLLAGTEWLLLAAVAGWLALAWVTCRPDGRAVPTGLALAGVLAGGALFFGLAGGLGAEVALARAARAALLVLVATWLRAAAGAEGLREVSRRGLGRMRRLPAVPEAAAVLDEIASEGRLTAAGRALAETVSRAGRNPAALLDSVLAWVAAEAARFRAAPAIAAPALRLGAVDVLLVLLSVAPAAALFAAS